MFGLHLKNYKSFEDQQFDFSKINILIGTNSSGKSALLKFFLMLKQSLDSRNGKFEFKGEYTDLGLFEDVVRDKKQNIDFKITFHQVKNINKQLIKLKDSPTKLSFQIDSDLGGKGVKIIVDAGNFGSLEISKIGSNQISMLFVFNEKNIKVPTSKFNIYNVGPFNGALIEDEELLANMSKLAEKFRDEDFNEDGFAAKIYKIFSESITDKESAQLMLLNIASGLNFNYIELLTLLINLRYYNPFNSKLERSYGKENAQGLRSVKDLNTALQILTDESIEKETRQMLQNKLKSAVQYLGIADDILVVEGKDVRALELRVKTGKNGEYRNIVDVGFGVSLQIPLLLQVIISNEVDGGQTILIEQPEIHIHPNLQAKLMEILVKYGEKNTYIIETHSIHLIEKLQVLVKQGVTKKEDVTIHYFTKENDTTKVSIHKIEEDGFLDVSLPQDFFDVSYQLVSELLA